MLGTPSAIRGPNERSCQLSVVVVPWGWRTGQLIVFCLCLLWGYVGGCLRGLALLLGGGRPRSSPGWSGGGLLPCLLLAGRAGGN